MKTVWCWRAAKPCRRKRRWPGSAALRAAAEINESLTNTAYDGAVDVSEKYTKSQYEAAIKAGEFVFYAENQQARVLTDINSLTTFAGRQDLGLYLQPADPCTGRLGQ